MTSPSLQPLPLTPVLLKPLSQPFTFAGQQSLIQARSPLTHLNPAIVHPLGSTAQSFHQTTLPPIFPAFHQPSPLTFSQHTSSDSTELSPHTPSPQSSQSSSANSVNLSPQPSQPEIPVSASPELVKAEPRLEDAQPNLQRQQDLDQSAPLTAAAESEQDPPVQAARDRSPNPSPAAEPAVQSAQQPEQRASSIARPLQELDSPQRVMAGGNQVPESTIHTGSETIQRSSAALNPNPDPIRPSATTATEQPLPFQTSDTSTVQARLNSPLLQSIPAEDARAIAPPAADPGILPRPLIPTSALATASVQSTNRLTAQAHPLSEDTTVQRQATASPTAVVESNRDPTAPPTDSPETPAPISAGTTEAIAQRRPSEENPTTETSAPPLKPRSQDTHADVLQPTSSGETAIAPVHPAMTAPAAEINAPSHTSPKSQVSAIPSAVPTANHTVNHSSDESSIPTFSHSSPILLKPLGFHQSFASATEAVMRRSPPESDEHDHQNHFSSPTFQFSHSSHESSPVPFSQQTDTPTEQRSGWIQRQISESDQQIPSALAEQSTQPASDPGSNSSALKEKPSPHSAGIQAWLQAKAAEPWEAPPQSSSGAIAPPEAPPETASDTAAVAVETPRSGTPSQALTPGQPGDDPRALERQLETLVYPIYMLLRQRWQVQQECQPGARAAYPEWIVDGRVSQLLEKNQGQVGRSPAPASSGLGEFPVPGTPTYHKLDLLTQQIDELLQWQWKLERERNWDGP